MTSFYTQSELKALGIKEFGEEVLISRKASLYGTENMIFGSHVRIDDFCILSGKIAIKDYVHISACVIMHGDKLGIEIGNFCGVSGFTSFYAASDDYSGEHLTNPMIPEKYKKTTFGKIIMEDHVLIGSNCTILPGVHMGYGCSVGAMSLITRDLEPWTINAGVPCKMIKPRSKHLLELEKQFLDDQNNAKTDS